ncbi:hypothetical protein L0M92_14860, partial [Casaltella massiliensis]|nr:hypothetical protein [Casaltella massiliensis]
TIPNNIKYKVIIQTTKPVKNVILYGNVEFIICKGKFHPSTPNDDSIIPVAKITFIEKTKNANINDAKTFATSNFDFP